MNLLLPIITIILCLFTLFIFANWLFFTFEYFYGIVFNKPFFVHRYSGLQKLTLSQLAIVRTEVPFYTKLNKKHKFFFEHRIAKFISTYEFVGKEDFIITDTVKILIAATYCMLTFGFRNYLLPNFNKIIIFPSIYYSSQNDAMHKGEYNPIVKAVAFSWQDFMFGFETNDNINLGLHEFTHVIHHFSKSSDDSNAIIFKRMFLKIIAYISQSNIKNKLIETEYFRQYAYTNSSEFISVLIEHYFETPNELKQNFPELFKKVSIMLNHIH